MSCMFFSFVLVYLYVSQCTLTWKNGYAERHEFKQKSNQKIKINQGRDCNCGVVTVRVGAITWVQSKDAN